MSNHWVSPSPRGFKKALGPVLAAFAHRAEDSSQLSLVPNASCPKCRHGLHEVSDFQTEAQVGIHAKIFTNPSFPARDIERCIRDALADQVGAQNVLRPQPTSACEPEIDSLVVVEIICAIEEILGVSLPASFAPRGGYEDAEACVTDLMAETRGVWVDLFKKKQHHE